MQASAVAAQTPTLVTCSKPFQRSEKQRQEHASNHKIPTLLTSMTCSQAMYAVSYRICVSQLNVTIDSFTAMLIYRTTSTQLIRASNIEKLFRQLILPDKQMTETQLLVAKTCRVHKTSRDAGMSFSSTLQQSATQPQPPIRTTKPSSRFDTGVECKLISTPQEFHAARGPQQPAVALKVTIYANIIMFQQNMYDHCTAPAYMKSMDIAPPPNTSAQTLLHIPYDEHSLLKHVLYHVLHMLNMVLHTLLPLMITSTWLSLSIFATVVRMCTDMSEIMQPSKCVQRSWLLQTRFISVSVMSITSNLTLFILAQVHCMLALAAAYSFLAHPHWINACLMMVYAPTSIKQLTIGLTQTVQYAIQSIVKNAKQPKLTHPKIRNGKYWRRISNRTRRLHKQHVYKYVKALCWLHRLIQNANPPQPQRADTHANKPGEHCIHKKNKAKCQDARDKNAAQRHKRSDTQDQVDKTTHHRRSATDMNKPRDTSRQRKANDTKSCGTRNPQVVSTTYCKTMCIDASNKDLMKTANALCVYEHVCDLLRQEEEAAVEQLIQLTFTQRCKCNATHTAHQKQWTSQWQTLKPEGTRQQRCRGKAFHSCLER